MYTTRVIEGALPILARALVDGSVNVVIGGDSAYSEGASRTIGLPSLPPACNRAKALGLRFVVHESGHLDSSDFDAFESFVSRRPQLRSLVNSLEDIRIERLREQRYRGARDTLEDGLRQLIEDGNVTALDPGDPPLAILSRYVLYRLSVGVLGRDCLRAIANQSEQVWEATFPKAFRLRAEELMDKIVHAKSTSDAICLATLIWDAAQEEMSSPSPSASSEPQQGQEGCSQQPSQQGDQNGGGGDTQAQKTPNADAKAGQSGQFSNEASPGTGSQSSGANELPPEGTNSSADCATAPLGYGGDALPQGGSSDNADRRGLQALLSAPPESGGDDIGQMVAKALSEVARDSDAMGDVDAERVLQINRDGSQFLSQIKGETRALRRKLTAVLESRALHDVRAHTQGKVIMKNVAARIQSGSTRIFEKRTDGITVDCAVQVLLDVSSSMKGRLQTALFASGALAMACEETDGVDLALAVFPYRRHTVGVVKQFKEPLRRVIGDFASVDAAGLTPMPEAMLWGGQNLMFSERSRRILLVVTDGKPQNPGLVRMVMQDLGGMGIEFAGVGIRTNAVETLFPRHAVIDNVEDLVGALFDLTTGALLEAA